MNGFRNLARICLATVFLVVMPASSALAADLEVKGEYGAQSCYFPSRYAWEGFRQWVDMDLAYALGSSSSIHASLEFLYLNVADIDINSDEFYLETAAGGWDIRLGRQLIPWAMNRGESPNDVVNPADFTNWALLDAYEQRLAVYALALRHYGEAKPLILDLVMVPRPEAPRYPVTGRWQPQDLVELRQYLMGLGLTVVSASDSENNLDDWGGGFRLTATLGRTDLGFLYYRGLAGLPVFSQRAAADGLTVIEDYPREEQYGLQAARAVGGAVFSMELSYTPNKPFTDLALLGVPSSNALYMTDVLRAVLEAEYTKGGFYFLFDYCRTRLREDRPTLLAFEPAEKYLGKVSYSFEDLGLELSLEFVHCPGTGESLAHPSLNYSPRDGWEIEFGACFIEGDSGMLGQYAWNDYLYCETRFFF